MQTFIPAPFLRRAGLLIFFFVLLAGCLRAQTLPAVAVAILDSLTQEPVPATIRFAATNETYKTTAKGLAIIPLKPGSYTMIVSSVGYAVKTMAFAVADAKPVSLTVTMQTEAAILKDVTISAQTKPIETKEGKLIYYIDKSLTAQGTTAFDQVRKTPGITVVAEDNLSLKGSSAVTIMIDGKQTYLSGQQLSTYLKSLPAESLQRIEVMSTPSSQYDAAGNAGIINIIAAKTLLKNKYYK